MHHRQTLVPGLVHDGRIVGAVLLGLGHEARAQRKRIGLDQLRGHRIESIDGNPSAGERIAYEAARGSSLGPDGGGVENIANRAEVSAANGFERHRVDRDVGQAAAEALVVSEKEDFVPDDPAAEASAKLVLPFPVGP